MHQIGILVGSLRRESINLKLAHALIKLKNKDLNFKLIEIRELPLYNEDLWESPPNSVLKFKEEVEEAEGIIFVTPEYNRSIPSPLKNAIDWGSRPWGKSSWAKKPASIVGTSPSSVGTAIAQSHLRVCVTSILDMALMPSPEVYLTYKDDLIGSNHEFTNEDTRKFICNYLEQFASWLNNYPHGLVN